MNPLWWWLIGPAAFLTVITIAIFLFWLLIPDPKDDERVTSRGTNGYREHQ